MPVPPKYFQIAMTPAATSKPHPKNPSPKLLLEIRDLCDDGADAFLKDLHATTVLKEAVNSVLNLLYSPQGQVPGTRSITLVLRSMGGVAYTTGKDIDSDHKEIHFSTDYIAAIPKDRRRDEMLGVLRHEMVHCWQWNALGTAPGGLIEGIADYVRLRSGLVPGHWKQEADGDWDAGYQHTGYFLDYLEQRFGDGTVMAINEKLRNRRYDEDTFWTELLGHKVKKLWKQYGKSLSGKGEEDDDDESENEPEQKQEQKNINGRRRSSKTSSSTQTSNNSQEQKATQT